MLRIRDLHLLKDKNGLKDIPQGKILINTINAHSFNTAQTDGVFAEALTNGDILIPDGQSIVWACKFWNKKEAPAERCSGWDLFSYEMEKLNSKGGKCLFVGSTENTLSLITRQAEKDYPNIAIDTYSPPFEKCISEESSNKIISYINQSNPDLLWIGMTAPKQEKWAYSHWNSLRINCHCGTIGAVFDFFAGTTKRAPVWMQRSGLEWFSRLCSEPKRLWKRYLIGNVVFCWNVITKG